MGEDLGKVVAPGLSIDGDDDALAVELPQDLAAGTARVARRGLQADDSNRFNLRDAGQVAIGGRYVCGGDHVRGGIALGANA